MSGKTSELTVPAAQDNEPMTRHLVCGVCWPEEIPMGTPALCGEPVLGNRRPLLSDKRCEACEAGKDRHALRHRLGR
jgi:hypothetical protein